METRVGFGRDLGLASVPNLRDVGGYRTAGGGRVRTGLLYRSTALSRLSEADAPRFEALGVRTVYDLRSEPERTAAPDRLLEGIEYVALDVIAGFDGAGPAGLFGYFEDPASAREGLDRGQAEAIWIDQFRAFATLPSAHAAYGRIFRDIALEERRPALVHCGTGKDRTGWAAATLLLLLGVPYDVVLEDFLRSALYLAPLVEPMLREFASRGGDPELLTPVVAVRREYLDAGLAEVDRRYGSIEGYLSSGLGVDAATRAEIKRAFIERV